MTPLSVRPIQRRGCQYGHVYHQMGSLMLKKNWQYTASIFSGARSHSASVITSNMFGVGELHNPFAKNESPSKCVKSQCRRCVLGCKDTKDGPLCIITPQESGWYCVYVGPQIGMNPIPLWGLPDLEY
jgi:hypothetical protein